MAQPRSQQVSLATTHYYHCIGRCVRRAFLCGEDTVSGRSFEHRRAWIMERLALLSEVFAIDLYAYAIMSNHYHLVVRISPEKTETWSDADVAMRWLRLYTGPPYVRAWLSGVQREEATTQRALEEIAKWRVRLSDLSWFMRCLNEPVARRANEEDGCTGHFWEGRFKTQALRDEASVLRCMAYVDLNPVRAGMAAVPEQGEYTSFQQRCQRIADDSLPRPALVDLSGKAVGGATPEAPCTVGALLLNDYLELVDWTGRVERTGSRQAIPEGAARIMQRLALDKPGWLGLMRPRVCTVRPLGMGLAFSDRE